MLNCDFKSYRCKSYYLPIIKYINPIIEKNTDINLFYKTLDCDVNILPIKYFNIYLPIKFIYKNIIKKTIFKIFWLNQIDVKQVLWFTKLLNLCKLYVFNKLYFFSPGMVLKFLKIDAVKFKRKLKTWISYIDFFKKIKEPYTIIIFKKIFGMFQTLLYIFHKKKLFSFIFFIRTFLLNFIFIKKKKKRIKKWVKKKFYVINM